MTDSPFSGRAPAIDEALDVLPCGVLSFDDDGTIVVANATLATMLGYERALFGSNYPTLIALPLALATSWTTSMLDARHRDAEAQRLFDELSAKASAQESG